MPVQSSNRIGGTIMRDVHEGGILYLQKFPAFSPGDSKVLLSISVVQEAVGMIFSHAGRQEAQRTLQKNVVSSP